MERQVGRKLFQKQGNRIALTDAGRVLVAYAVRILALNDAVLTSLLSGHYVQEAVWLQISDELPWLRNFGTKSCESKVTKEGDSKPNDEI